MTEPIVSVGAVKNDFIYFEGCKESEFTPTHWMPLPQPPEETV